MGITTKAGDAGQTSLLSGKPVSKSNLRVEALGAVDEAAAFLGIARAKSRGYAAACLKAMQSGLFFAMTELADDGGTLPKERLLSPGHTEELEGIVSHCEGITGPLVAFVTPGDTPLSADLHVARTVLRRAERRVVALHDAEGGCCRPELLSFLNRASDAVFALSRLCAETAQRTVPL